VFLQQFRTYIFLNMVNLTNLCNGFPQKLLSQGPDGDVSDLAAHLGLPVILVVGMKLGCINHALLTADAIVANGSSLAGWVANQIDPGMLEMESNLETLREGIDAPCLGFVPFLQEVSPQRVADYLRLQGV
jgi:dethiobiotin synthetase